MGEEASDTSSTVEDTTFVSIDSTENSINSIDTSITDPPAVHGVDISKSKYFKANPQTVGQMLERKGNYLTPDQKVLKTGLAVLEYMRLSGKYTAKQIMDYAKYMAVPVNRLEKYMELYL